ncbi:MAG: ABC transporter permease [Planctomycetota bacterium]
MMNPGRANRDPDGRSPARSTSGHDRVFWTGTWLLSIAYLLMLMCLLGALAGYTTPLRIIDVLGRRDVIASLRLTLVSATTATLMAVGFMLPLAYLLACRRIRCKLAVESVLDLPHVMPPLVLGLSMLVLFQTRPMRWLAPHIVYQVPAVFLAQFVVAASYALPILRSSLQRGDLRHEQMAMTMGCTQWTAFIRVTLPENRDGLVQAIAMAWARCVGTFGPVLVFAGATRNKTEVLSTTIYLELGVGDLEAAVAVSLVLVVAAASVLWGLRWWAWRHQGPLASGGR